MRVEDHSRDHYYLTRYLDEHLDLEEVLPSYKNVGWSLGNSCPLRCKQCYSKSASVVSLK